MNLEQIKSTKSAIQFNDDFELDFKPITSGLGFNQPKPTEIKPVIVDRTVAVSTFQSTIAPKKEMNIYQNDLSLFYGQASAPVANESQNIPKTSEEKSYSFASRALRVYAYTTDLLLIFSFLGIILTVMARTISMDLLEVWNLYPNEITPLSITLFCGFYVLYFSIFEKTSQSTLGKNIFGIRVTTLDNQMPSLGFLALRSFVGLLNFVTLGLFSYFDLQSKITSTKVVRIK